MHFDILHDQIHERIARYARFVFVRFLGSRSCKRLGEELLQLFTPFHQVIQFTTQNLNIERLRDIIIRTGFKTDNDILTLHLCRQHDNRGLRSTWIGLQLLTGFEPVFDRHHHIAKNQVRIGGKSNTQTFFSVTRLQYLIFFRKDMFQEPAYLVAVVDNEDFLTGSLLLRDHLDKFGNFFLLAVVQFHQVGFRFHKFHTAFHQMLFTQRY